MTLLLDQGLPRSTVQQLEKLGLRAIHVGECGLASADDGTILKHAQREGQFVVTLDADFHRLLALSGASGPSVVRIRIEALRAEELAELLHRVVKTCGGDLERGALATVTEGGVRVRCLPLTR